jgi:arsenate reductase
VVNGPGSPLQIEEENHVRAERSDERPAGGISLPPSCRYRRPDSRTSVPLFSERFARQRLRALARVEGKMTGTVPSVVFLCTHNAGRSQMAAAWAKALSGDRLEVFSGGSDPASEINPAAIEAMREVGIDIKGEFPKPWTDEVIGAADVIITMGCGDACPIFPGKRYEDWEIEDPAGQDVEHVRPIRDDIESRVKALLIQLGVN